MTEAERKIARIIWDRGSITTSDLAKICLEKYGWKTTTTYTFVTRLKNKGYIIPEEKYLKMSVPKESYLQEKARDTVIDDFSGSLPMFVNAFTKKEKLSEEDIRELQKIIDRYKEE